MRIALYIGTSAFMLLLAFPSPVGATGVCTCTYTRTSVSSGVTSSEGTHDVSNYSGAPISTSSACPLGCDEWATSRTADSSGALIYTITNAKFTESTDASASSDSAADASSPTSRKLLTPVLSIDIPTVTFSDAILREEDGKKYISVNYLGEYISGVYKYLLGISMTIAIVMLMVSGLQWALGGHSAEAIGKAQGRIKNAVAGIVLLLSAYLILYTVNPQLLKLQFPELEIVKAEGLYEIEDEAVSGSASTSFGTPSSSNVYGADKSKVSTELVVDIDAVAKKLESQGYGMRINDTIRSLEEQKAQIAAKCKNPPGSATCDPIDGKTTACILINNDPANCAHTSGKAMDIWGTKLGSESQCITQSQCQPSLGAKDPCRLNECQAALITAMKEQGFCNLSSEAWHFEKPKMSTTCN